MCRQLFAPAERARKDGALVLGDRETAAQTVTFKHSAPVIDWIGAPVLVAFLTYLAYFVLSQSQWGWDIRLVVGFSPLVSWLIASAFAVSALSKPRVSMTVTPDGVVVLERWLWRSRESRYAKADLSEPEIAGGGGEDAPPVECVVRLPNGRKLTICRGGFYFVKDVRDRLVAALRSG